MPLSGTGKGDRQGVVSMGLALIMKRCVCVCVHSERGGRERDSFKASTEGVGGGWVL